MRAGGNLGRNTTESMEHSSGLNKPNNESSEANLSLDFGSVQPLDLSSTDGTIRASANGSSSAESQRNLELAYNVKSDALRKKATVYSWVLALVVYPLFFAIGAVFYWLSYREEGNIQMLLGFGGSQQFDYVLICHIPIVICLIFLLGFIFKYWHEPEVRSRNHDFTLHFLGMGLLQEVVLILTAALTLQIMPLKAVDMSTGAMNPDWSTAAFWAYLWLTFCLNQLLVPNLARMRYIKALFCEQNEAVSYWILPLGYLLLWFCTTFVSLVYCQFNGSHTCNLWETYSGLIVFLALHNIHYYYCAWKSRHARHLFIDYISNIRLYTIFVLFFWVLIVITLSGENQVSLWYLYFYQPWFMLVIFSLENFAFLVARVLGRKWGGENALGGIDMVGEHYRESESRNKGVEELLGVEHTRKIIQQVARQQLCEENVDFLIAVYACNQTKPASISMVHSIASQFLESSSPKEINITGSCRDRTLKAIQSEDPMHYKDTEPLFRAAVAQVMKNVSTNCLPDVYKSKEYKKWALLEKKNMLECY